MNSAYLYLQLYRLFDDITPVPADCGALCDKACCKGDEGGMYLFPGEERVYSLLKPDWIRIEESDFTYFYNGERKKLKIAFCDGTCDRYQRPLACRIFPLTPYLEEGRITVITDPRAKAVCPLAKALLNDDYDRTFRKNVKNTFVLLGKNPEFRAFLAEYSAYLDDFGRFYK
ncbi:MAG: hypothetical protein IJ366_03670 [Clostridia bacterium]|nr:hypothetical protein [Clostridia bacterium]